MHQNSISLLKADGFVQITTIFFERKRRTTYGVSQLALLTKEGRMYTVLPHHFRAGKRNEEEGKNKKNSVPHLDLLTKKTMDVYSLPRHF